MKGYVQNSEKAAERNTTFRTVLYTAKNCQLVVMSLKPGEVTASVLSAALNANRWTSRGSKQPIELPVVDLEALKLARRRCRT